MDASAHDYEQHSESPLTIAQPTFSSLLAIDPSQHQYCFYKAQCNEDITPLSKTVGIQGVDRELLVNEIHRIRHAKARTRRRRLAAVAGLLTLSTMGCCTWFTAEAIIALFSIPQEDTKWKIALAEVVLSATSVLFGLFALLWLRYTRRPTNVSKPVLVMAGLTVVMQLSMVSMNFILACLWRSEMSERCQNWGLDVVWRLNLEACPGRSNPNVVWWLVAIGMRFLISTIVGSLWMHCLRAFHKTLNVALIIPTSEEDKLLQSSEVQTILARHSAIIVMLTEDDVVDHARRGSSKLPHMPEERRLLTEEEWENEKTAQAESTPPSTGGWLWSTVTWLFGINSMSEETKSPKQPLMQERMERKIASYTSSDVRMPDDLDAPLPLDISRFATNSLHPDYDPNLRSPPIMHSPKAVAPHPRDSSFRDLLGSIGNRQRTDSDATVKQPVTSSSPNENQADQSFDSSPSNWQEYSEHSEEGDSYDADYLPGGYAGRRGDGSYVSESFLPSNAYPTHHLIREGSGSGSEEENLTELPRRIGTASSNGQKTYVRMSDGRLVRKLSTIASSNGDISRSASSGTNTSLAVEQQLKPTWLPRM